MVPSGLVCGINPGEGSEVATSTPISLQISQGPETKTAEVPDLGGLSLEKARTKLEEAGLKVGEITYRSSESSTDTVIGQDPVFGSQVSEGSYVNLTLSSGDRDIGSVQLYITLPENGSATMTATAVQDGNVVMERQVQPNLTNVWKPTLTGYGTAEVEILLDGEHYRKEGKEIAVRDFYQFMVDNPAAYPKTSLASIEDYETAFRAHAAAGRDVLCLVFTGKMSGCVGSARNARELVLEDYPDARIEVIDSAAATVTESTMVENAVAMRDAGCTLDETVTWLEAEKVTNQIFFTVGNLDYLIKGGRIGKVTGRAANMLGIKPMILFKDGEIFSGGVARGRQKSFEKALDQLMNYLEAHGGTPDDYRITVGYGYDADEGKRLWMQTRAALRAKYPGAQCEVGLLQIGCTIAVHTGPYALGMGIMRRWKKQG